jgi:hypothetical protein
MVGQAWISARRQSLPNDTAISALDTLGISPVDFSIDKATQTQPSENGRTAAEKFLSAQ